MNEQDMVRVVYVGLKDKEQDTIAGTNLWWVGLGDIQEVPLSAWPKLAKHPDVWALAEEEPSVESAVAEADEMAGLPVAEKRKPGRPRKA